MNDDNIDNLLSRLRHAPRPEAPDLRREVRAEISRLAKQPSFWQRVFPVLSWDELFRQPRIAGCAVALALAVGTMPALIQRATAPEVDEVRIARASLNLDSFETPWRAPMSRLLSAPRER